MSHSVQCSICKERFTSDGLEPGGIVNCPACGSKLRVPAEASRKPDSGKDDSALPTERQEPSVLRRRAFWLLTTAGLVLVVVIVAAIIGLSWNDDTEPEGAAGLNEQKPHVATPEKQLSTETVQQTRVISSDVVSDGMYYAKIWGALDSIPRPELEDFASKASLQLADFKGTSVAVALEKAGVTVETIEQLATVLAAARRKLEAQSEKQLLALSGEEVFERCSPAVVQIITRDANYKEMALGSGFFVNSDGTFVTNWHVMKGASFATIRASSGTTFFVDSTLAWDVTADLAVLSVKASGVPHLELAGADQTAKVGTRVYAIGYPRGLKNILSNGLVGGFFETKDHVVMLQTNAAISPGSSGGPLIDEQGRVVGVTTASVVGGQNLNLAVPVSSLRQLLSQAKDAKPKRLASSGGTALEAAASTELDEVWSAIRRQEYGAALRHLQKLREGDPRNAAVWNALGWTHFVLNNDELAIEAYEKAVALAPDALEPRYRLGSLYDNAGRHADAVEAFKVCLSIDQTAVGVYCSLGEAYSNMGRHQEAINACKTAIELAESDGARASCYRRLAGCYEASERTVDAVNAYQAAIRLDTDPVTRGTHWLALASLYARQERWQEAAQAYEQAIELTRDAFPAGLLGLWHYQLGCCYIRLGRLDKAHDIHRKLVEMKHERADELEMLIEAKAKSNQLKR